MRSTVCMLLFLCHAAPSIAAGEKQPEAPKPGEVKAGKQAMGRLPFITPGGARQAYTKVTVSGGKGSTPIPGLSLVFRRGLMAVVSADSKVKNPIGVAIPPKGFSQAITAPVKTEDGSPDSVALCFRWTGRKGEYWIRNMTVAAAQYADCNVVVVDDNCNGRYNDLGEDAVIAGRGGMAAPLGSTVLLGGRPYGFQVSADGRKMTFTAVKDYKLGYAMVSNREGHRLLIGAVLKGPSGGYHVIGDRAPSLLPVGSYSFAFASLGNPVADQLAILEGGSLGIAVKEGKKVAVLKFGRPQLKVSAIYDPVSDRVKIDPPDRNAITCKGGTFRFFFRTGTPKVDIVRFSGRREVVQSRDVRMPTGGRNHQPTTLSLSRRKYNLDRGKKYRFDVRWPNGVVDEARGSATLTIPRSAGRSRKVKKK